MVTARIRKDLQGCKIPCKHLNGFEGYVDIEGTIEVNEPEHLEGEFYNTIFDHKEAGEITVNSIDLDFENGEMTEVQRFMLEELITNTMDFCGSVTEAIEEFCYENDISYNENQKEIEKINFQTQMNYWKESKESSL